MKMLINISNEKSSEWEKEKTNMFSDIIDIDPPKIIPCMTPNQIKDLSWSYLMKVKDICKSDPDIVCIYSHSHRTFDFYIMQMAIFLGIEYVYYESKDDVFIRWVSY